MSEMMKRVGAAILLAETQWTPKAKFSKEQAMARAAIEAMRDPTDAMLEAGGGEPYMSGTTPDGVVVFGEIRDVIAVENIWQAMIDAELPELDD